MRPSLNIQKRKKIVAKSKMTLLVLAEQPLRNYHPNAALQYELFTVSGKHFGSRLVLCGNNLCTSNMQVVHLLHFHWHRHNGKWVHVFGLLHPLPPLNTVTATSFKILLGQYYAWFSSESLTDQLWKQLAGTDSLTFFIMYSALCLLITPLHRF